MYTEGSIRSCLFSPLPPRLDINVIDSGSTTPPLDEPMHRLHEHDAPATLQEITLFPQNSLQINRRPSQLLIREVGSVEGYLRLRKGFLPAQEPSLLDGHRHLIVNMQT